MDPYLRDLPKMTLRDVLVNVNEFQGKAARSWKATSIEQQRDHFQHVMAQMASEEKKGWSFHSKTKIAGLEEDKQLDIYSRDVEWSTVKVLRTVVTSSEASVSSIWEYFQDRIGLSDMKNQVNKYLKAKAAKAVTSKRIHALLVFRKSERYVLARHEANIVRTKSQLTHLLYFAHRELGKIEYRRLPFPWPLSDRFYCQSRNRKGEILSQFDRNSRNFSFFGDSTGVVQHYVLVDSDPKKPWIFTYNHDVHHPHFNAPVQGLVRVSRCRQVRLLTTSQLTHPVTRQARVRRQGMVVVPHGEVGSHSSWFVNIDFGGLVPGSFSLHISNSLMFYVHGVINSVIAGERNKKNKDDEAADVLMPTQDDLLHKEQQLEQAELHVNKLRNEVLGIRKRLKKVQVQDEK